MKRKRGIVVVAVVAVIVGDVGVVSAVVVESVGGSISLSSLIKLVTWLRR